MLKINPNLTGRAQNLGAISAFFAIVIWALAPVLIQGVLEKISILQLFLLRYSLSFLITLPFFIRLMKKMKTIPLKQVGLVAIFMALHIGFQAYSLSLIPVSWYATVFAFVPIMSLWAFDLHINIRLLVASLVMLVGAFLLINLSKLSLNLTRGLGLLWALATSLAWVYYTKVISKAKDFLGNWDIAAINNTTLLGGALLGVALFPGQVHWQSIELANTWPLLILAISTPIAYVFFSYGLREVPAFTLLIQNIELAVIVGLSALLLGQTLSLEDVVGLCFVTAGLYLICSGLK